jgi:hypothetical protein
MIKLYMRRLKKVSSPGGTAHPTLPRICGPLADETFYSAENISAFFSLFSMS